MRKGLMNLVALATACLLGAVAGCGGSDDPAPSVAPRELAPSAGLYVADDTPLETAFMPMLAALVDANFATSTGVAIGTPDGTSFQNVGLDMGRAVAADELQVAVRDDTGRPLESGGVVDWTVYTSLDGLSWTRATTTTVLGSPIAYDPAHSQWTLRFDVAQARYFKAVNLGTLVGPAYVTELRAFMHPVPIP